MSTAREGQTLAGTSLLTRYFNFVRLPHTVFALPFALIGVVAASFQAPVSLRIVVLVTVAFAAARWAAMGFNRIVDRHFDAMNPRTAGRELPRGALTVSQAWISVVVAAALFLASAALLNPLCRILAPVALLWILAYSLTKRFTWWTHVWLGLSLAIAPVGGYLAVTGRWSEPAWVLLAITVGVASWVAGFDVFYALPDAAFDRRAGLRSLVVRFGERRSILLAKLLHGITIPAVLLFGIGVGFGVWYFAGVAVAAAILAYEHQLVKPGDLSRLDTAFFTMNGIISIILLLFAVVDRVA